MSPASIRLRLCTHEDYEVLAGLFRQHLEVLHTFNPHVDPNNALETDWVEKPDALFAYLLEATDAGPRKHGTQEQGPLGFALVGNHKLSRALGLDVDFIMWEFFVAESARRQGVGRAAMALLAEKHAGTWSLEVLPNNGPASGFWGRVLRDHGLKITDWHDENGVRFNRHQFCFAGA